MLAFVSACFTLLWSPSIEQMIPSITSSHSNVFLSNATVFPQHKFLIFIILLCFFLPWEKWQEFQWKLPKIPFLWDLQGHHPETLSCEFYVVSFADMTDGQWVLPDSCEGVFQTPILLSWPCFCQTTHPSSFQMCYNDRPNYSSS